LKAVLVVTPGGRQVAVSFNEELKDFVNSVPIETLFFCIL